jgi:glycosyltransferase involved in cell wall biosynthesis
MSRIYNRLKPVVYSDFAVIDSQFPQKLPLGFRNTEINGLIREIKNASVYCMYPMKPGEKAWFNHGYGVDRNEYEERLRGYSSFYPNNSQRISYLQNGRRYRFKLAYSFFLAETYVLLPFYKEHGVPFVFELYPGGGFGLGNASSDNMLKEICSDPLFMGVIVTQAVTNDYLIKKQLCPENKIHFIFGGFSQYDKNDVCVKKKYPVHKKTFDISFVAGKYSRDGVDKGFDVFLEVASILSESHADIEFHVVGGFKQADEKQSNLKNVTYYGYKSPEFLASLYSKIDIALSPNMPGVLYEGNFDGFPLTLDAMYCGSAAFLTDDLCLNKGYYNDAEDIVIINHEPKKIAKKIENYYNDHKGLYELAKKGQRKSQKLFSADYQLTRRIKVLEKIINIKRSI